MNTRRRLLIALGSGALAAPFASFARQPAKFARIGFLGLPAAADWTAKIEALRSGLAELGYVEGKNLAIDFRWAEGKYERLPALAAELVRLKVDIIVTHATPGVRAAKQATATIPIVIAATGDPVASGLVASLARPGGNATGSSFFTPQLAAKRLELIKEAIPRIRRVAVLFNASSGYRPSLDAAVLAAKSLKLELQEFGVRGPNDFESAFAAMAKRRVDAAVILEDPTLVGNAREIAEAAAKQRLPAIGFPEIAEAGGLMAYGANIAELHRRAAVFIDKILKGAKPGDLPVEQATKFELIINLRTAKKLGLSLPQSTLARTDRVIE